MRKTNIYTKSIVSTFMQTYIKPFLLIIGLFAYLQSNAADDFTSIATGSWEDPTIWDLGTVPTLNDNVTIAAGTTVTMDFASDTYIHHASLIIEEGGTLIVNHEFEMQNTVNGTFVIDGTLIITGDGALKSGADMTIGVTGSVTVDGDLDLSNGSIGSLAGSLTVGGDLIGAGIDKSEVISNGGCPGTGSVDIGGTTIDIFIDSCLMDSEWEGDVSTEWDDEDNWKGNIPDIDRDIIIPTTPVDGDGVATGRFPHISVSTAAVNSLVIETDAYVKIETGGELNVAGNLDIETDAEFYIGGTATVGGTLTVDNGYVVDMGTLNTTAVSFTRETGTTNWYCNSSPVSGVYGTGDDYDETAADTWADLREGKAWLGWDGSTTNFDGKGFIAQVGTLSFSGAAFNTGDVATTLSYTSAVGDATYDGWNLVGNPYPCKISSPVTAAVLTDGAYESFVASVDGTQPTSAVPLPDIYTDASSLNPAQGFFTQGPGTLTFQNSNKISPNSLAKKKRGVDYSDYVYNVMRLQISANSLSNVAALRLYKYATEEYDKLYDARKRISFIAGKPELFALTPADTALSISTIPETNTQIASKLGYYIDVNSTCTIELLDYVHGSVIILKDKLLNKEVNIAGGKYTFTTGSGTFIDRFEIIVAPPVIWRGKVSDDWNTAENWDKNMIPTANQSVIIPARGLPLIEGEAVCKSLYLKAGANLTINGSLSVSETITIATDEKRSASIKNNGILLGNDYIVEKFVAGNQYTLLSSPVDGTIDNVAMLDEVSSYSEQSKEWSDEDISVTQSGESWKYLPTEGKIVTFSGIHSIKAEGYNITAQASDLQTKGVNLIGNPFLAALDIEKFVETNKDVIDGTAYLYTKQEADKLTFDDYTYTNKIGTVGFGEETGRKKYLRTGEALFVKALSDAKVHFTAEMQVAENELYPPLPIDKPTSLRFNLVSPSAQFNETLLAFTQEATDEYDNGMDAAKLPKQNSLSLYTVDKNMLKLAIQTLNDSELSGSTVKLGYSALENGKYILNVSEINKLENSGVYLRDNETDNFINLKLDAEYSFETEAGTFDNRFELVFTTVNRWTGTVSNDWSEAENWEHGIPTEGQTVIIPSNKMVELSSTANCYEMVIEGDAQLIVDTDGELNIEKDLILKAGIKTASVLQNGTINVTKTRVELNRNQGYTTLISSPVGNAQLREFTNQRVFRVPENGGNYELIQEGDNLSVAEGYRLSFKREHQIVELEGELNNGNIEREIVRSENSYYGLNLVGNPYPTVVNGLSFLETNAQSPIEQSIIRWKEQNDAELYFADYVYCTLAGTVGAGNIYQPSNNIEIGEGFFVRASANGNVNFDNSMRITDINNKKRGDAKFARVKIGISNDENLYNETLVAFTDDATDGYDDGYDTHKIEPNTNIMMYSVSNEEKYAINTHKDIVYNEIKEVALGFYTGATGNHKLQLIELADFTENFSIELIDNEIGTRIDLRKNDVYTFDINTIGEDNDRFVLHFERVAPEITHWTGAVSSDWNNPENWDIDVPGENSEAIIQVADNYPVIEDAQTCGKLTILPDAVVETTLGSSLNVKTDLIIKSDAAGSGILLDNGTLSVTGNSQFEKFIDANSEELISPPVANATEQDFANAAISIYDTESGTWKTAEANTVFAAGNAVSLPQGGTSETVVFEGILNTGDITLDLKAGTTGFNLIGNPYPSPIDWSLLDVNGTNVGKAIYRWDDNLKNFKVNVNNIGNTGSGINTAEGFMVYVTGDTQITLDNTLRVKEIDENIETADLFALTLVKTDNLEIITDEAFLHLSQTATDNFDLQEEALKLFSPNNIADHVYFKDNEKMYAVLGINENSLPAYVAAGFKGEEGTNYTLTAGIKSFTPAYALLEDKIEETVTDILTGGYSYIATTDDTERFILHFNNDIVGLPSKQLQNINIYAHQKTVYISTWNFETNVISAEIHNIMGQKIYSNNLSANSLNKIALNVPSGIYIVTIISDKAKQTRKVVIE